MSEHFIASALRSTARTLEDLHRQAVAADEPLNREGVQQFIEQNGAAWPPVVTPLMPGSVPVHWTFTETLAYMFSTLSGAPPAAGTVRFNNANASLVTHMYVHKTARAAVDVSTALSAVHVGTEIRAFEESSPGKSATFTVTAISDAGPYLDYTVTPLSGFLVTKGVTMTNGANIGLEIPFQGDVPIAVSP